MTIANPLALLWGLLAVPIVLLYRRRLRLRREAVATGMIWERVFAEDQARRSWQRWRRRVSLAVQLTVLAVVVLALIDVQIPGPRRLVLILDNSAGMNATDVEPSRLDRAKEVAGRLIEGLRCYDSAAVLSAGGTVGVHCNLTGDRAVLGEAVASVSPTQGTTPMDAAVALARRMLDQQSAGRVVLLSDGCFEGLEKLKAEADIEWIRIGKTSDNLAVTRLQARRHADDPLRCQVLAEVSNFADKPITCGLQVSLDDKQIKQLPVELPPNGRRQKFFDVSAGESGTLTVRLDRADDLPEDNQVSRHLPPAEDVPSGPAPDATVSTIPWADLGESDLRVPGDGGTDAATIPGGRPWPPAWLYLAALGVLWLALEWCFYQRRWIC